MTLIFCVGGKQQLLALGSLLDIAMLRHTHTLGAHDSEGVVLSRGHAHDLVLGQASDLDGQGPAGGH